jgi:hypothetical protein
MSSDLDPCVTSLLGHLKHQQALQKHRGWYRLLLGMPAYFHANGQVNAGPERSAAAAHAIAFRRRPWRRRT